MVFQACAGEKTDSDMKTDVNKVLVVYYSETGTTEAIARKIASATEGDLYRIIPQQPYSAADLDWRDADSRSSKEMNDPSARPAIINGRVDLDSVGTIYLGYPIWWDQAPRAVNTFIESNNLGGKKIVLFCTSGETTIEGSVRRLRADYPSLDFVQGKRLNGASRNDIEKWISTLTL